MESTTIIKQSSAKYPDCIWMQANVVRRKSCKSDYNCTECRFDRVMKQVSRENARLRESGLSPKGKKGRIVSWKEQLKSRPLSKRPCIHHMKGRIEFRACTHEYRCGNCDFDQYFNDQFSVHAVVNPVHVLDIKGFQVPQGFYIHPGHTWVKMEEGSLVKVGLDDFALRLLGPLDRIEAPLMGKEVKQGRADINISRGNREAKLTSPISGVVTAINPRLREEGSIANQHPYTEGWVMAVQADHLRQDLKNLMINQETGPFMEDQVGQLYHTIEEVAGPLATDGGHLGDDIFGSLPELEWEMIINTFLKA